MGTLNDHFTGVAFQATFFFSVLYVFPPLISNAELLNDLGSRPPVPRILDKACFARKLGKAGLIGNLFTTDTDP